ncbi:MAG: hypothetical protein JST49_16385 [Bacteroidetes bacterium]|nr:hypothetical protein [Bacteroidota bacterium]
MKKLILPLALFSTIALNAQQNVGIGTNDPKSKLDINGGLSVGSSYSGTSTAPTNGAIIEGRVGIGTNAPDSKAILDVSATDKGMYLPRLTNAQAAALGATLTVSNNGLLIFNSDNKRAEYWDTNQWKAVGEGAGGTPTGAAGGDLTGTYPNPTVATNAINGTKVLDGSLTGADIQNTSIDLTTKVNNVLPVSNGGTGVNTVTGIMQGNGSSAVTGLSAAAANQYLRRNSANTAYEFGTIAYSNISGTPTIPTTLPPSGAAGGDLTGAYPNPTLTTTGVSANTYGSATAVPTITVDAKGRITSATSTTISGVAPAGAAGGDLTGTYPNPTLTTTGVSANTYGSATTVPTITVDAKGRITSATSTTISGVAPSGTAGGDLTGTYPNPTVDGLQGRAVAATAPSNGQVLKYNTSTTQWEPGTDNNTTYTGGTAINVSGTTINNTGVTSVAGTANQVSVSAGTGAVTFSLPQNIHTSASPTFANVTASGKFYGNINMADTRSVNSPPTSYNNEVSFDFKALSAVGSPGSGTYGGVMTMAPWGDNSGDASHQLMFNEGGIYWRQGQPDATTWDAWTKINTGSVTNIATSGTGIGIVNGDGVSGTPTISLNFGPAVNVAANGKHPVGNFGQFENHGAYTDFNTVPNHWGWNYVQGSANGPNSVSSQWYREIVSLGGNYAGKGTGGYSLELAYPRFNTNQAGVWVRTTENGTPSNWVNISGPPIGSIMAWHKNGANMPALPDGWVECNGQTLSDAASPLNGTAMPNLNGTFTTEAGGTSSAGRFLRGGATSGTFASDRTNSVTEMLIEDNGGGQASQRSIPDNGSWSAAGYNYYTTGSNDGIKLRKKGVETNPGSMTVVWIMKVK